jgi:hypothetical protein
MRRSVVGFSATLRSALSPTLGNMVQGSVHECKVFHTKEKFSWPHPRPDAP